MLISAREKEAMFRRLREAEARDTEIIKQYAETHTILIGHVETCAQQNEAARAERLQFRKEMRSYLVTIGLAILTLAAGLWWGVHK